jgi:hypothetical protein
MGSLGGGVYSAPDRAVLVCKSHSMAGEFDCIYLARSPNLSQANGDQRGHE